MNNLLYSFIGNIEEEYEFEFLADLLKIMNNLITLALNLDDQIAKVKYTKCLLDNLNALILDITQKFIEII